MQIAVFSQYVIMCVVTSCSYNLIYCPQGDRKWEGALCRWCGNDATKPLPLKTFCQPFVNLWHHPVCIGMPQDKPESGSRLIHYRLCVCESETAKVKPDWCESVGDRGERKGIYVCVCLYRRPRLHWVMCGCACPCVRESVCTPRCCWWWECSAANPRGEQSTAEEMLGRSPLIRVTAVGGWCGEEIRNWIRKWASRA